MRVKDAIGAQLIVFGESAGHVDIAECNETGADILVHVPKDQARALLAITGNMTAMLSWFYLALPVEKRWKFSEILTHVETLKNEGAFDRAEQKVTNGQ